MSSITRTNELSVVLIKHLARLSAHHPRLIEKVAYAAMNEKPDLIVLPEFIFYSDKGFDALSDAMAEKKSETALITTIGRAIPAIRILEEKRNPLLKLNYEIVTSAGYANKSQLDLLISFGNESPEEHLANFNSIKSPGYDIRMINSFNNAIVKKNPDNLLSVENPIKQNKNHSYDLYILSF